MPVPVLSDLIARRSDPQLSFTWACQDATLPFGLPSDFLEAVDIPFNNVKIGETIYANGGYNNFPGSHSISGVSMSFYEDDKGTTMRWIDTWKRKIKDFDTGYYNLPGDGLDNSTGFKQQVSVELLNTRGERVYTVQLIGLWPEATSNYSLNYTDNGRIVVAQSFSIDDMKFKF